MAERSGQRTTSRSILWERREPQDEDLAPDAAGQPSVEPITQASGLGGDPALSAQARADAVVLDNAEGMRLRAQRR